MTGAADAVAVSAALDAWIDTVAVRFPRRARVARRMKRSPFWCRCLLVAIAVG